MANIAIASNISSGDSRGNEFSCELQIENRASSPIEIISINPRIPDGVDIQEIHDTSVAEYQREHQKICSEIALLLDEHNFSKSREYRQKVFKIVKEDLQETFKLKNVANVYYRMITGQLEEMQKKRLEKYASFSLTIHNSTEAESAINKFLGEDTEDEKFLSNFIRMKLDRLRELEKKNIVIGSDTLLSTIGPSESFDRTYVFKCERGAFNSKSYNLSFDCSTKEPEALEPKNDSVSVNITVSPNPVALTLVALLGAFLGVILKESVNPVPNGVEYVAYWSSMFSTSAHKFVAALVSALIFFNIYEHTELGKKLNQGISWRSVLMIGAICGLLNDRIIAALTGLITG
ncbi:ABC-2 transporter permease [Spartinivicinus ruber]|uniref:hypothetical protein n=1 Tax=Spartinivicinus ruber TaxID=2683272 RepID=UPI0013D1E679|nr:hypothetical protein [Spartinivicinus ruber]